MGGGILIEADSKVFSKLLSTRTNPKIAKYNIALFNEDKIINFLQISGYAQMLSGVMEEYDPRHLERIKYEVNKYGGSYEVVKMQGMKFESVMKNHPEISRIDYLSIDVEGGEMKILESIDFACFDIRLIGIENNYADSKLRKFLKTKGYKRFFILGCDEFYQKI